MHGEVVLLGYLGGDGGEFGFHEVGRVADVDAVVYGDGYLFGEGVGFDAAGDLGGC